MQNFDQETIAELQTKVNQLKHDLELVRTIVARFSYSFPAPRSVGPYKEGYDVWLHDYLAEVIKQ